MFQYLICLPNLVLSKSEEVCCAVVDCGIGDTVIVETVPSDDEEDASVVVDDSFVVVACNGCRVVGVNEDDSRSFPASVSVVDEMTENELIKR